MKSCFNCYNLGSKRCPCRRYRSMPTVMLRNSLCLRWKLVGYKVRPKRKNFNAGNGITRAKAHNRPEGQGGTMKVFISQPMAGLSEMEIRSQRATTQSAITEKFGQVEFISTEPKTFEEMPTQSQKIEMLADSLKILAQADKVVLIKPQGKLPNGCFIETSVAKRYGIEVITYRPDYCSGWEEFG